MWEGEVSPYEKPVVFSYPFKRGHPVTPRKFAVCMTIKKPYTWRSFFYNTVTLSPHLKSVKITTARYSQGRLNNCVLQAPRCQCGFCRSIDSSPVKAGKLTLTGSHAAHATICRLKFPCVTGLKRERIGYMEESVRGSFFPIFCGKIAPTF